MEAKYGSTQSDKGGKVNILEGDSISHKDKGNVHPRIVHEGPKGE